MQAVKLLKPIPHEGLSKGDVLNVDELSAKSMIDAGKAEKYTPPKETRAGGEKTKYAGQEVETIDDIVDHEARGAALMTVRVVSDGDKTTKSRGTGKPAARGASGAKPTGGDSHEAKSGS